MVRLRELAGLTVLAMVVMTSLVAAGVFQVQIPGGMQFHLAHAAAPPVQLASTSPELGLVADRQIVNASYDPQDAESEEAFARVRANVPEDLYPWFDVYLYVSKARAGSLAQHMFIFHKTDDGDIQFEQAFPVSTGRERHERYFTSTPTGLFELDPERFERNHYSHTWHARMPWAMFLDAAFHGSRTGIALHSAGGHAGDLGSRASGGCVRLPPEKAAELFQRFQREERGNVPRFAYDDRLDRTSPDGMLERDAYGRPVMQYGYRVLLIIEDYPGGPAMVAALV